MVMLVEVVVTNTGGEGAGTGGGAGFFVGLVGIFVGFEVGDFVG
jgi:hypothetical protein